MKPFFAFLTILFLGFPPTQAQDLILTAEGDSINCLITRIKNGFIYFSFQSEGEVRHTLIPASRVRYYQPSYFQQAKFSSDQIMVYPYDYQRFKLTVYFGNSILTREFMKNTPPYLIPYFNELRSGQFLGGNFILFPRKWFGWGIDYARFRTNNQLEGYTWQDPITGLVRSGLLRDDITIQFVGPALCFRYFSPKGRFQSYEMVAIGNMGYFNNFTLGEDYIIKSNPLGARYVTGLDIMLTKNLSVGMNTSWTIASISQYEISDGAQTNLVELDSENHQTINRIELALSMSWNIMTRKAKLWSDQ